MALYNTKSITYEGDTYVMYPGNLTSETQLTNAAQDATETAGRVYPVRLDANGKLAVNVPWENTTYSFTDSNPTLAWGTQSKVATVGGVDIHVTLPANPNTDHYDWSDITNKPANYPGGCTGAAGSVAWANVTGKPSFDYLPLSGGTMSGVITTTATGGIAFKTSASTYNMIKFIAGDQWGQGVSIGGGGLVIVGAGESSDTIASNKSGGDETLYMGSDGAVYIYTNCQSGMGSAKTFTFDTSGQLTATRFIGALTGDVTGSCSGSAGSVAWGNVTGKPSSYTPSTHYHKELQNYYGSRPASANLQVGDGYLRHFKATSSMSTGKPTIGDSHIIHMAWDNNGGWDGEIALGTADGMQFRNQSNGTWRDWRTVLHSANYTSYVPQVWSGKVNFSNGVSDLASIIGSGKTIYAAFYNGDSTLMGFVMGCSGTKVYLAQIIPGTGGRIVPSGSTNQPITIIYK